MKRFVTIVQGSLVNDAGCRPRRTVRSGSKEVNMNRITLAATNSNAALRLKLRRLSLDNTVRHYSTYCGFGVQSELADGCSMVFWSKELPNRFIR